MEHSSCRLDQHTRPEYNPVTRRRTLEHHRHSLAEIRGIMNSMKTLAYMETRKLARFLDAQQAAVRTIEETAVDLLGFHPEILPTVQPAQSLFLMIGADRGFCGDFNRALVRHLESVLKSHPDSGPALIAIGRKLHTLLDRDARVVAWIDGASLVEEVPSVLNQVVDGIITFQGQHGALEVFCIYHGGEDGVVMQRLLPPFQDIQGGQPHDSLPPLLNLSPKAILVELTDQYLFAALHAILYTSLITENHHRVTHLDGAVRHLDEQAEDLARQCNALRQEEIIEEIEVILLSATSLAE
jgi:F-type H+-transporting ATPase subunit gamma